HWSFQRRVNEQRYTCAAAPDAQPSDRPRWSTSQGDFLLMPTKTPAAILVEKGKPMVIDDIELPDLGPSHVLVKQFATGVCHSQLHELDRPEPQTPLVLGHESTGVVVATGANVSHVKEG